MRAFIYLPTLRASTFPKIPVVPSVSGQDMRYRRWDETQLSRDSQHFECWVNTTLYPKVIVATPANFSPLYLHFVRLSRFFRPCFIQVSPDIHKQTRTLSLFPPSVSIIFSSQVDEAWYGRGQNKPFLLRGQELPRYYQPSIPRRTKSI